MDFFIWCGLGIIEHIDSADYHNSSCCSAAGSKNGFPQTAGDVVEGTLIIKRPRRLELNASRSNSFAIKVW
jgi:hypothetical protein